MTNAWSAAAAVDDAKVSGKKSH